MPSLSPDTALGPYVIVSVIGTGGMGEVYRARDSRIGRDVAIKVLTAAVGKLPEYVARFEQEARATGMLNHPNLVTVYDVGQTAEGSPYLVTELLEGETLRERMDRGVAPRAAIGYALQIAQGLAAAHEKGIVHRDLKPENVFVTRDGRVKILDFGIAKLSAPGTSGAAMAATEPGMILGTVGYMSPEQVRGEVVDQRSDIFALGTIIYEMLAGARPFRRDTSIETMSAILTEDPLEISEVNPNIPPALERIVRHCLVKDREQRFQTARDLAFNLESLAALSAAALGGASAAAGISAGGAPGTGVRRSEPPTQASAAIARPAATGGRLLPIPGAPGAPGSAAPATSRTAVRQAPRPTGMMQRPPLRSQRTSRVLLGVLGAVALIGAGYAAATLGGVELGENEEPAHFNRMTFRRGEVSSARFTRDGETIIYAAAWDGGTRELFLKRSENPESRPLAIPDADVLAISKSDEMALLLRRDPIRGLGTLARVPLVGGNPREVLDEVADADWAPDGRLAAVHRVEGRYRIEFPTGTMLYESKQRIRDLAVSPDGKRIAFLESIQGENDVAIIPAGGGKPEPLARGWKRGAAGLVWSSDGKEVWLAGTDTDAPPALWAVALNGDRRLVSRLTGQVHLHDLRSGRALVTHAVWRANLMCQAPGATSERDLSWFDWSIACDLSDDGRVVLFNESREGGGLSRSVYLRRTDGTAAQRLGDGTGDALSPDGTWALTHPTPATLAVVHTGKGQTRALPAPGSYFGGADFFPDGKRVVMAGFQPQHEYALVEIDVASAAVRGISPERIWGDAARPFAVSPDGATVAGMNKDKRLTLYPAAGGEEAVVAAAEPEEIPIQWSADGSAIYVYRPRDLPARVHQIDLVSGVRTLWKELALADPAGVQRVGPIFMTPDASAYVYNVQRSLSDLYLVDGLR